VKVGENMVATITLITRTLGTVTEVELRVGEIRAVTQMAPMPGLPFIISRHKISRLPGLPALTGTN
jgi:hypothetical protein